MSLILIFLGLAVLVLATISLARHRGVPVLKPRSSTLPTRRPHPDDRRRPPDEQS